ncbi:type VII secretion integral membrane protein EccD [Mycolicibacillus trivialis]|uniref:Type VII secretion integral membrane protein EccD n=1 Tax=Mycolicibacillus trivialis TaxID=1798 RepID=A0A1X2EFN5_9MYCO|nr:type VII secretion integral membrane protein EccD [Mycolicibacillus trivialis]ORX00171.1 type VII secretion integral membrane protein EccD [Mycolicibacillus trivialis]
MTDTSVLPDVVMPIVRVAVLSESRLTEMALPAELPLREILPAVQQLVAPTGDDADDHTAARLSLAPVGGAPFSLDATLDTVGVVDGDLLALQPVPAGPPAPGIVEDIADAAVIFSASRTSPWKTTHIQRGALGAVIAVVLAATGLAVAYQAVTGDLGGLFGAGALALLTAGAALVGRARSGRVALALSVTALAPIAAACILAVPGVFGPAHLVFGAAGALAWSLISLIVPRRDQPRAVAFFTASSVVASGVLLAAGAAMLWDLPIASLGCGLIALSLIVTISAPQFSALCARLPLPVIPAPGDPTPAPPSQRLLKDLPRRVRTSDSHQSGFVAGAVLLSVLGSVAVAATPDTVPGWGWYLVGATAAASVLRARVWDSAACKAWLLAQPYLLGTALLVIYAATGFFTAASFVLLAVAVLALAWAVVALNPVIAEPESYSLPMRRILGFIASGLDASLIPVMAYLVGLFSWILDR